MYASGKQYISSNFFIVILKMYFPSPSLPRGLGIGLPFTIQILTTGGNPIPLNFNLMTLTLSIGLGAALLFSFLLLPILKGQSQKDNFLKYVILFFLMPFFEFIVQPTLIFFFNIYSLVNLHQSSSRGTFVSLQTDRYSSNYFNVPCRKQTSI